MADDFKRKLEELLDAHPPQRVSIEDAKDAAVLIPIVAVPEPTLIFTLRTDTLGSHKGQISFPGGRVDSDDASPRHAALREAHEEIGLDPGLVEVIGELDTCPTYVSGYVVQPFVGWLEDQPTLKRNPAEVEEILHVPISALIDEIRHEPGFEHAGRSYPTEAWVWNDHVIWGVTARIVRTFLLRLADAGLATAPGETSSWTGFPLEWSTP